MSTKHKASHSAKHQQAIETSRRYLHTIKSKTISRAAAEALIAETLRNFANHYNPGFLDYRKSVTEGGDFAAVEWSGRGATFTDALGRTFLDCLGGYGLLSLGWSHEKVIEAVKAQLDRAPMPTQDLLDPPRGMLANLLAQITPATSSTPSWSPAGPKPSRARSSSPRPRPASLVSSRRCAASTARPQAASA